MPWTWSVPSAATEPARSGHIAAQQAINYASSRPTDGVTYFVVPEVAEPPNAGPAAIIGNYQMFG